MEEVIQKDGEARLSYLVRVLHELMSSTCAGEERIIYDGAECDGACLAEDIAICAEVDLDIF